MDTNILLRCLGQSLLEGGDACPTRPIEPATQPLELLLRVAAAGPDGASATMLCAAMWPHVAPEARRKALRGTMRRLDMFLSLQAVLLLDGNRVFVNEHTLGVDSIELEAAIAPLLNPFSVVREHDLRRAREALARSAAGETAEFLPDVPHSWAVNARMRIADGVERARRMLQTQE
jgi:hypothetical protein